MNTILLKPEGCEDSEMTSTEHAKEEGKRPRLQHVIDKYRQWQLSDNDQEVQLYQSYNSSMMRLQEFWSAVSFPCKGPALN